MVPALKEFAILGEMSEDYFKDYSWRMLNHRYGFYSHDVHCFHQISMPTSFDFILIIA